MIVTVWLPLKNLKEGRRRIYFRNVVLFVSVVLFGANANLENVSFMEQLKLFTGRMLREMVTEGKSCGKRKIPSPPFCFSVHQSLRVARDLKELARKQHFSHFPLQFVNI